MMPSETSSGVKFQIGHVLFIDIVGYAKLLINEQTQQLETLKKIVRHTEQVRSAGDILENNPKGALEHASLEQEGLWRDFATVMALQAGSDKPAADAALQAFIHKYAKAASFQVAILYAQRHQPDEMFKWLETAYANRDGGLVRLFVIPFLIDYRDDPRWTVFCRKLGIETCLQSHESSRRL